MAEIGELLGQILVSIENIDDEEILFTNTGGKRYKLHHHQGCCEEVRIEDICGDLKDLVGEPILLAEEVIGESAQPVGWTPEHDPEDSVTWTFYKFATRKGYVDIRWLGSSNGYYSESVDFEEA